MREVPLYRFGRFQRGTVLAVSKVEEVTFRIRRYYIGNQNEMGKYRCSASTPVLSLSLFYYYYYIYMYIYILLYIYVYTHIYIYIYIYYYIIFFLYIYIYI